MGKKNSTYNKTSKQPEVKRKPQAKVVRGGSPNWIKWAFVGAIVVITFIVFAPALKNNFTNWDDNHYVTENTQLAKPIGESISYYFSNFYFCNYHPLTMIVYAMEFHSVQLHPELYHKVSLLLHLLNVMLVFWFIYLLSGKKLEVGVIVAFFFGIHPMRVESVAWIAELKDVLYTFFFMGGLIAYYKYIKSGEKKNIGLYLLTFILFILSGLSKPAAVIFPLVLILIDYYTKRKFTIKVWLEKIPMLLVALTLGILTVKAQETEAIAKFEVFTLFQRFMFTSYAFIDYIGKLFLPINLSAVYPYPVKMDGKFPIIFYAAPVIALALFYGVYRTLKFTRIVAFGFLFYLVSIMLVLQFVSVGIAITADRYSYVPYIGLLFAISMGFSWLYRNKEQKYSLYKSVAMLALIVLAIASCALTNTRVKVWQNSDTLWTDQIEKHPENSEGYKNMGGYLVEKGKYDVDPNEKSDYERALVNFNIAIPLKPDDPKMYSNRGNIYGLKQKFDSALNDYSMSLRFDPNNYEAYLNRGITYSLMKNYDSAIIDFNKALTLNHDQVITDKIFNLRAYTYINAGKLKEAMGEYDLMIKQNPNKPDLYFMKGYTAFKAGDYEGSITNNSKAIELKPDYKEAFYNRSQTYTSMQKYKEALEDALKAKSLGYPMDTTYIPKLQKMVK